MTVTFTPGQTLGQGDLDIYLVDSGDHPANAFSITFALYYVDPSGPEVLIGSAARVPANPTLGEYYAPVQVPPSAVPGNYRIRWSFQQYSTSPVTVVVQEWTVVAPGTQLVFYSEAQMGMMNKLRMLLRDHCVGGEEKVELDLGGERLTVSLEEFYGAVGDLSPQIVPEPGR